MGYILFYLVMIPFGFFWGAYVESILWQWFIVPLGVQPISLYQAAGISFLFISFMGARGLDLKTKDTRDKQEKAVSWFAIIVFGPAMLLLFGWLARLGM